MSTRDLLLALDVGTQSSRAILHDKTGAELSIGRQKHPPLSRPMPGAVYQDPLDIYKALCFASKACMEGWDAGRIAAVSLTSQRSAVIPTDAHGEPLSPAISWLDRRSSRTTPLLPSWGSTVLGALPDSNLLVRIAGWSRPNIFAESAPDIFEKAKYWLTFSGWLTQRLTGEFVDAAGSISGVFPLSVKDGDWQDVKIVHRLLGFRPGTLPRLVPAGSELGRLTTEAAEAMGLVADLPLIAVGGDKQAEVLGAGVPASSLTLGALSLGTAASVCIPNTVCKESPFLHFLANAAAEPNAWINEVIVMRGFWMVSWFVREFAGEERRLAEEQGTSPEAILSARALAEVPPGADGLMLLPRFTPATDVADERGALLGLSEEHGRLAMFRAIIEGIAFDLRRGLHLLERNAGRKVEVLRVGGGGSRSEAVVQATASVLGRPLELGATHELSALGASMCAAVSLGWYADTTAATQAMSRVTKRIEPDPQLAAFYDELYNRAFLRALKRVRPLTAWLRANRLRQT